VLGFSPKFGALIQTIPLPVMGGVSIVVFGLIAIAGAQIWVDNKVNFLDSRNMLVAAITLVLGYRRFHPEIRRIRDGRHRHRDLRRHPALRASRPRQALIRSPAKESSMAQHLSNQRIAWFNGKFMPENQVMIPFRDRSWKYGDGAFDMTRTFEGQPFRLKEHIDRFYRSLRYLQIDPGIGPKEMVAHSEEVVARNEHLRPAVGDWWVGQRVQPRRRRRGRRRLGPYRPERRDRGAAAAARQARQPLPRRREVITTTMRRTAPSMLSPRAKTHNYLNMIMAEKPVKALDPDAWAILLDENGNLAEGWAATSSSCARASCSRRRSATCCRRVAAR
jgi:branched-subunit amino acid aminotransferase/4-amino-4-deoxychorismate lyase